MANEFKVKKGLIVQGSGSSGDNTILDVQGNQGQLFSITDSLEGTLFSVSDISGIPILDVNSNEIVKIGTFGSEGIIVNGSNVTASAHISASGTITANAFVGDGSGITGISGFVDTSGTVNANEFARFSDSNTLTALTAAETRAALNVDDGANNYVLPTNLAGDDIDVDTGALTGAVVVSDIDINITTNTSGLVTDANGAVSTRTLTLANLGYTGATDATNNTGTVDTTGTINNDEFPQFSDSNTLKALTVGEMKTALSLNNVANESRATILGGNLTGTINSVAVATVTAGAALGATSNQDSTSTIRSGTTKSDVDLGNVTNESKATMFSSAALTGNPTAPTQAANNNSTRIATTAYVQTELTDLIGTAPSTLDTLGELSASLASDQTGLASLTTTVGTKLAKSSNLSDLSNASTARTNLDVDQAGTDNSTNVTLSGTPDYITISGQTITRNAIDLTADVTGVLPIGNGGTGQSDLASVNISEFNNNSGFTTNTGTVTGTGTSNRIALWSGTSAIDSDSDFYVDGDTIFTTNLEASNIVAASEFRLDTLGDAITFYGGGQLQHSIMARDASGTAADDLRINSYGAVYVNLDSNNNNTSTADFVIGNHGDATGTINTLFTLSGEDGDATFSGTVVANGTTLTGATDISGKQDTIDASNRLNANLIGSDGSIGNTEFGRLNGLTGNIQTQLDAKQGSLTFGIGNGNVGKFNANVADNDFLRIDGTSIEGRSAAEMISDLGIEAGATANTGTVTSVSVGTGLDISNNTTTPAISLDLTEITLGAGLDASATGLSLDLSELTDMTADVVGSEDELILLDNNAERKKLISEIKLSQFNNDSGFTGATDISGKQDTITGAATTIDDANLTANRAVISNGSGKIAVSDVTSTELGYLDGVTSAVQTQLNAKAASGDVITAQQAQDISDNNNKVSNATHTGDVTGATALTIKTNVALAGNPTTTTQTAGNASTRIATTAFVGTAITNLIGTAPAALDTLGELSASLANDQDALSSLTTTVGTKLAKSSNLSDLSNAGTARTNLGLGTAAQSATGDFATAAQGTKADAALPKSGGTMSGNLLMGNSGITGVNLLEFNDPGPGEGLQWNGGNMKLYESPNDLTTNTAGNLQFVYGSTRRLTVDNSGIDVNGTITVSGTVDGRDIAADGTRLDGIEDGATADQSNAEIRAAVEAATDSNVFTDNDHSKLNGIEAAATADQSAAEIRNLLGTGNGNLVPSAGSSGQFLKHDGTFGTPSYTTNTDNQLSQEQVEDYVGGMLGGTETGITVTYQDATGDIDFVVASQTDNNFTTALKNKLDGFNQGLAIDDDVQFGDTTITGNVIAEGDISVGNNGKIVATNTSTTYIKLNNDDGFIINANNVEAARMFSSGVVINEGGIASMDFRVESDSNNYALFVDSGNNQVVIGGATGYGGALLSVNGDVSSSGDITAVTGSFDALVGDTSQATSLVVDGPITASGGIISDNIETFWTSFNCDGDASFATSAYGPNTQGINYYHWNKNWTSTTSDGGDPEGDHVHRTEINTGWYVPYKIKVVGFCGGLHDGSAASTTTCTVKLFNTAASLASSNYDSNTGTTKELVASSGNVTLNGNRWKHYDVSNLNVTLEEGQYVMPRITMGENLTNLRGQFTIKYKRVV